MIAQESAPGIMTEEFRCTVGLPGDVDSPQSIKGRTVPEGRTALFGEEALDISTDITVMENLLAQEGLGGMTMGGSSKEDGPKLEL